MNNVGAFDAKTNLARLLDRVANGERITITRHGVPVAMLVPASGERRQTVEATIADIIAFRRGRTLRGLSIRRMIEEGRR